MSFNRVLNTLIIKSNNLKSELSYLDGIELYNYDSKDNIKSKKKITKEKDCFSKSFFQVDCNDNIYGILFGKKNKLIYFYIDNYNIYETELMHLKNEDYIISFPYIKKIGNKIHLFFYLIHKKETYKSSLIHYFFNGNTWSKFIISQINYFILSNFVITWQNDTPYLFFLNQVNGNEEVFISSFNINSMKWKASIQITNSHKNKVYLSVIEGLKGNYHITFSENNNNKYHCSYINIAIEEEKVYVRNQLTISKTTACEFPNVAMINKVLYIQWIEFNGLFTSLSKDFGRSWSPPKYFNNDTDYSIIRYEYKVNPILKNGIYLSNIFSYDKLHTSLGIPENILNIN